MIARVRLPRRLRATSVGALIEAVLSYAPTTLGRASRTELFVTILVAGMLGLLAGQASNLHGDALTIPSNLLLGLLIGLPILSALIRRTHDLGSDASLLLLALIPYVGLYWLGVVLLKPSAYDD